ncbi:MAG: hypothetical protein HDR37_01165 [Treponema sp.]|nr:hypothetical protein [Treponema sp.]
MKLWMSAEQMSECYENMNIIREIEPRINELIKDCTLADYVEWAVIDIILNENGPNYKEIVRRSLKNKELEFRLKIDYYDFMKADYNLKKRYVLEVLFKSLDLMAKWKEIKLEEREKIKEIIKTEYAEIFD